MEKPSGMDLASDRLANLSKFGETELKKRAFEENSIVYGQVNRLIIFKNVNTK